MKNTLKLAFTLTIWSVIACAGLAFVNSFTAPIIKKQTEAAINNALVEIFPEAKDYDDILANLVCANKTIKIENAFLVKSDSDTLGVAITATGPTYASSTIMLGLQLDGSVKTIKFISNTDTKGIGTKVQEEPFISQFDGKKSTDEFQVGVDVEGVSGATVSSKGVLKILKTACNTGLEYLKKNNLIQEENNEK